MSSSPNLREIAWRVVEELTAASPQSSSSIDGSIDRAIASDIIVLLDEVERLRAELRAFQKSRQKSGPGKSPETDVAA
jgi:hypothetical protein